MVPRRCGAQGNTWFLIWWHELLQTFHGIVRSLVFCWVALDPTRTEVLHHDCTTMLQTRFVLVNENFSPVTASPKLPRMMIAVSSCIRAVPARNSSSFRELADFTIRIFLKMCETLCLPGGFLVFGLLDTSATNGRSVDCFGAHPHIIRCFLF